MGLDIIYRKTFYRSLLNDYFDENRTIIITTHQVEEIESILTHVLMINKGHVLLHDSMEALMEKFSLVTAAPDKLPELRALNPIDEQTKMGQTQFLFEGIDFATLQQLGETSPATISDIFVAKVTGESS